MAAPKNSRRDLTNTVLLVLKDLSHVPTTLYPTTVVSETTNVYIPHYFRTYYIVYTVRITVI